MILVTLCFKWLNIPKYLIKQMHEYAVYLLHDNFWNEMNIITVYSKCMAAFV